MTTESPDMDARRLSPEALGVVPALVWAFRFHADGRSEPLDIETPIACGGWIWLHLNLSDARAMDWIASSALPQVARDAFLQRGGHQQLVTADGCIAGVV